MYHELTEERVDPTRGVLLDLAPGDLATFSGFTPHRSGPNRSHEWRRLLYLSYNAESEGGDGREAHYAEFKTWLQDRYAEYGKGWLMLAAPQRTPSSMRVGTNRECRCPQEPP